MNNQVQELLNSSLTLLVLLALAAIVGFALKKLKEYNITIKGLFGNNETMNQVIDSVYSMLTEIVTDVTMTVSEKYIDDGVITKEEMALIKEEAINIILKRLNQTQSKTIEAIYGDVMKWVAGKVGEEVTKIASGK